MKPSGLSTSHPLGVLVLRRSLPSRPSRGSHTTVLPWRWCELDRVHELAAKPAIAAAATLRARRPRGVTVITFSKRLLRCANRGVGRDSRDDDRNYNVPENLFQDRQESHCAPRSCLRIVEDLHPMPFQAHAVFKAAPARLSGSQSIRTFSGWVPPALRLAEGSPAPEPRSLATEREDTS